MLEQRQSETTMAVLNIVRDLLANHGFDAPIGLDDNLGEKGLTSTDMVSLMLSVEDKFNVSIPDREMRPANFRSVSAINALVCGLLTER